MKEHISFSSWKQYQICEAKALALDEGRWGFEVSDAMLVSSLFEHLVIGTPESLKEFITENPSIINSRTGELKAAFKHIEVVAEKAKSDPVFMAFLEGESQVKLEGTINGMVVRGIADIISEDNYITDLKAVANYTRAWNPAKRRKETFIEQRDYLTQGAIYRELYYQMTGKKLPFFLASTTKEEYPKRVVARFEPDSLDLALDMFSESLPRIQQVRSKEIPAKPCGDCDYCRTHLNAIITDYKYVGMTEDEIRDSMDYDSKFE